MTIKTAGMLLAALVLAGCATSKPPFWHKPNVSSDDTYTQLNECRFQVGIAKANKDDQELLVAHCMRGKGFRLLANDS
jgi:hypothetical protein